MFTRRLLSVAYCEPAHCQPQCEGNASEVAVTGLVLVQPRYAIANSNDISRIPIHVLRQDSVAMFIPKRQEPILATPTRYLIHPEFGVSTLNTLALLELDFKGSLRAPFKPVCLPGNYFDTSQPLYALGFTDEHTVMEKMMHTVQYIKPKLCTEFYRNFTEPKSEPTRLLCGRAANNKHDCYWANGMALVSNYTGQWTLIGFGVSGIGCATPARFIDTTAYFPWMQSATDLKEVSNFTHIADVSNNTDLRRWMDRTDNRVFWEKYPFTPDYGSENKAVRNDEIYFVAHHNPQQIRPETMQRGDDELRRNDPWRIPVGGRGAGHALDTLAQAVPACSENMTTVSMSFGYYWSSKTEACDFPKMLIYREKMKVVDTSKKRVVAHYRVSLYDKYMEHFTCVRIKIDNGNLKMNKTYFWVSDEIDRESPGFKGDGGTPEELLKFYPLPKNYDPNEAENEKKFPYKWGGKGKHLKPQFIVDKALYYHFRDEIVIHFVIGFAFIEEATMQIFIYGHPKPKQIRPTTTIRTTTFKVPDVETTTEPPEYWKRAHALGEVPYKPRKKKNRLEKARQRYAERKSIEREVKERKSQDRKAKTIKIKKKERKISGNVATTTESRNIFENFFTFSKNTTRE